VKIDQVLYRTWGPDVASHPLKVGNTAPDFLLPDADGRFHSSEQLRRNGPLVLSFFRGGCRRAASEWRWWRLWWAAGGRAPDGVQLDRPGACVTVAWPGEA